MLGAVRQAVLRHEPGPNRGEHRNDDPRGDRRGARAGAARRDEVGTPDCGDRNSDPHGEDRERRPRLGDEDAGPVTRAGRNTGRRMRNRRHFTPPSCQTASSESRREASVWTRNGVLGTTGLPRERLSAAGRGERRVTE